MINTQRMLSSARWIGGGLGIAAAAYLANAGWTWLRFGTVPPAAPAEAEPLLDAFMPDYDIVERHNVAIDAPAATALAVAAGSELPPSLVASAIFTTRELFLGGERDTGQRPRALRPLFESIGWEVLAEIPGREIVFGAVTTPWDARPAFRAVGKGFFAGFNAPGYVKIVFTLRADPVGEQDCIFRSETRAIATDPLARARFRRYWAFVNPGVRVIRYTLLGQIKAASEQGTRKLAPAA